jgi:hypothetical protein
LERDAVVWAIVFLVVGVGFITWGWVTGREHH